MAVGTGIRWGAAATLGGLSALIGAVGQGDGPAPATEDAVCACELRSWVVAGQGRHLVLDVACPEEAGGFEGVVEFTTTELRVDYEPTDDPQRDARIARMTPGVRLEPVVGDGQERTEGAWRVTGAQAERLLRDRVFSHRYYLLGPNSNSAMRYVLEDAGVAMPAWMLNEGGPFGQFPGILLAPGEEIPRGRWLEFGVGK